MKVNFGPFVNRWTTYQYHQKWLEWRYGKEGVCSIKEEDYDRWDRGLEKVLDGWQIVLNATVNKIKDRQKRKMDIRVDYYDVWGADHTLAKIIHPVLVKLQEVKHGSPYVDDEDVPEHLRSTAAPPKENEWDTDDNLHLRWEYVLAEMIWAFEALGNDDFEDQFYSGESDWDFVKIEGSNYYTMEHGPKHTFKVDEEAMKAAYARIANGTRLFGKYYRGLWG
jgi:hypothetical protein